MNFVWLGNADIERLVSMDVALRAVKAAFRAHGNGEAGNCKRSRATGPHGLLAITGPAVLPHVSRIGFKAFSVGLPPFQSVPRAPPVFALYDADGGALLALMDAEALGFIRPGAATGVATDLLSRPDSRTVGLFGAGNVALRQLEAVARVRSIERIRRDEPRCRSPREVLCIATERLGVETVPAADACDAVSGCDIVITATTSHAPLFDAAWVEPGTHINAVGSNFADRCEIDAATVACRTRCGRRAGPGTGGMRRLVRGSRGRRVVMEPGRGALRDRRGQGGRPSEGGRHHASNTQGLALEEDVAVASEGVRCIRGRRDPMMVGFKGTVPRKPRACAAAKRSRQVPTLLAMEAP